MLAEHLLGRISAIDICAQLCWDVAHHLVFINIHSSKLSMLQPLCSANPVLDKGEDKREKEKSGGRESSPV